MSDATKDKKDEKVLNGDASKAEILEVKPQLSAEDGKSITP